MATGSPDKHIKIWDMNEIIEEYDIKKYGS